MSQSRRRFLKSLAALPGAASLPAAAEAQASPREVYQELGIRPLINAAGTYTYLSASLMPKAVVEAIESASRHYVNLNELHGAVGKRISALLGCEAALVTSGAASALMLGTAACVAGKDKEKIQRLPDTAGMKNEVVIPKAHRNGYDHAVRAVALIDAAADIPPVENYTRFLKMGYDLAAFSGGKVLRGPQCSGFLLGRKDLVEAAAANDSPQTDAIGRTNKVGKEEIVGAWAALEQFVKADPVARWREWERRCAVIADHLAGIVGVKAETFVPEIANAVPHLRVALPAAARVVAELRSGEPRIEIRASTAEGIEVGVWMLEPGEDEIVGRRLSEILKR